MEYHLVEGSSNIKRIGYDLETTKLYIEFVNGGKGTHANVPESVWNDFQAAQSKGGFYAANIKGKYDYTRL